MPKEVTGMRGSRSRDLSGELRRKRSDTHVGTIEQEYDRDFGVRSDTKLATLLDRTGFESLAELLRSHVGRI
jgi:hypothetical protein